MQGNLREFFERLLANGYVAHLLTVAGFLLALFLVARLMTEKKAPANTFAWLLVIILIPYVGVPLFLIFGGRKLRRLAGRKSQLLPVLPTRRAGPAARATGSVAHTVAAAGGCPPVGGNRLRLLETGEDEFGAIERLILEAREQIHITTFILGRDESAWRLVNALAEKAEQGVKVRLLLDGLGCLFTRNYLLRPLIQAGGEVGRFMPVIFPVSSRGSANLRNHRKIAVFDHATAIIGGRNLANEYMGPVPYRKRWRDLGTLIEGPAAALLNEVFIADWCFTTRQSPDTLHAEIPADVSEARGPSELQVVASGPDVRGDPMYEGILAMIQEAEHSIWIVTPYFIPDDVLQRSLVVKARAGKDVTLVVPARSNHPVADLARNYYTGELRRAGARIMLYSPGMLHAKAMIVDNRVGLVGSANFDIRSLFVNFEIGVFAHSENDVQAIRSWINGLLRHCHPAQEHRMGAAKGLVEELSRLLAPLL